MSKIPIIINGVAKKANFFHMLKTFSEKINKNNKGAVMNRGVATNIDTSSSKNKLLHE
jgi:hypothetical protein